jgi:Sulfotransferase domain
MKVDFMIIGAQKCATTSLAHQLRQHPQVCFSKRKEPQYFSKTRDWQENLPEYHKLFSPTASQLCGEASTSYTCLPEYQETHTRLFTYNPELKLIYIMRDPIRRIESHYAYWLLRGQVRDSLEAEVVTNPTYINRSRYGVQMKPYLRLFPRSNILLLIFEEYVSHIHDTLEQVARFLGISPAGFAGLDTTPQNVSERRIKPHFRFLKKVIRRAPSLLQRGAHKYLYNTLSQKPQCSERLRGTLWLLLEDDVSCIEELLGRRLEVWRQRYE